MTSLLAFLITFVYVNDPVLLAREVKWKNTVREAGAPMGNRCVQCFNAGMDKTVTFTDSGWTCPSGHVGFLRSHHCRNDGLEGRPYCEMRDFVR